MLDSRRISTHSPGSFGMSSRFLVGFRITQTSTSNAAILRRRGQRSQGREVTAPPQSWNLYASVTVPVGCNVTSKMCSFCVASTVLYFATNTVTVVVFDPP